MDRFLRFINAFSTFSGEAIQLDSRDALQSDQRNRKLQCAWVDRYSNLMYYSQLRWLQRFRGNWTETKCSAANRSHYFRYRPEGLSRRVDAARQ